MAMLFGNHGLKFRTADAVTYLYFFIEESAHQRFERFDTAPRIPAQIENHSFLFSHFANHIVDFRRIKKEPWKLQHADVSIDFDITDASQMVFSFSFADQLPDVISVATGQVENFFPLDDIGDDVQLARLPG